MRHCSNPSCYKLIDQASGFIKAGDWLACKEGRIAQEQIRELCGTCGAEVAILMEQNQEWSFFRKIGWLLPVPQLLLPAPTH